MDALQYWAEIGQWEAEEDDDIERCNELAALARDEQYREELEEKFPYLKGWSQ